jgi:hypothetical protein
VASRASCGSPGGSGRCRAYTVGTRATAIEAAPKDEPARAGGAAYRGVGI